MTKSFFCSHEFLLEELKSELGDAKCVFCKKPLRYLKPRVVKHHINSNNSKNESKQ